MKIIYSLLLAFVITTLSLAQTPQTMSYQAVIRDASGNLVTEQEVGLRVSILQNSIDGTVVYQEIYNPNPETNNNGLLTIEIGAGVSLTGTFSGIDWSDGPYFLKTETDHSGGTTYSITGTSQLLSVPYAFHAKTAETISEPIVESDPLFASSPAAGIETADIGNWDEAHSWGDHSEEGYLTEESDPLFTAWNKSAGIEITESQISDLQTYYLASNPDGFITAYIVTEEDVTTHESALSISESQITDLQSYLTSITGQSIGDLSDVDLTDVAAGKVLKYDAVEQEWIIGDDLGITEETDPEFMSWDKTTGISINESQISDLGDYLTEETQNLADVLQQDNDADGNQIKNLADPTDAQDAATKAYVDNNAGGVTTYSVGDFAHGGVVFYVEPCGTRGLVAAKEDQSTGVRWYAGTFGNTQAKGDGPYAGKANTAIIIAAHVSIGDDGSTYAARICNELQVTEEGISYGDWYLPSKEELNLMFLNRVAINNTATANGGSAFASAYYWGSTEDGRNSAWHLSFNDGAQQNYGKSETFKVRAVRAF